MAIKNNNNNNNLPAKKKKIEIENIKDQTVALLTAIPFTYKNEITSEKREAKSIYKLLDIRDVNYNISSQKKNMDIIETPTIYLKGKKNTHTQIKLKSFFS
jgi:hypothetical protein